MKNKSILILLITVLSYLFYLTSTNAAIISSPDIVLIEGGTESLSTAPITIPTDISYFHFDFYEVLPGDGDWANIYFGSEL